MENRRKGMVLIIAGIIFIALIFYIGINLTPKARMLKEITSALEPVLKEANQSMKLSMNVGTGENSIQTDVRIYMLKEERKYFVMEVNGVPLYIADQLLVLKNGKAFEIADKEQEEKTDYKKLFSQIGIVYKAADFECVTSGQEKIYTVGVTEEEMDALLKTMPIDEFLADSIEKMQLKLAVRDKTLSRIEILGTAKAGENGMEVSMVLSNFQVLSKESYVIPEIVKNSIENVDRDSLFSLSEDLCRLIKAATRFAGKETLDGTFQINANCGILKLEHNGSLEELQKSSSNNLGISVSMDAVTNFLSLLCMEGEISCTNENDTFIYQLKLEQETMEILAQTLIPELVNYTLDFTRGNAEIILEKRSISAIKMDIQGNIDILISKIPASISVGIEFEQ